MHDQEQHITLTQAAKVAPGRPSTNALWRWCRKGVVSRSGQRIRLQHARIGNKIFTTLKWLAEFGEQVARADAEYFDTNVPPVEANRRRRRLSPSQEKRQQQIDLANKKLAAMGI